MFKRFAPLPEKPVARKYLDLLMAGKVDELQRTWTPRLWIWMLMTSYSDEQTDRTLTFP